jgi:hypothetical protein
VAGMPPTPGPKERTANTSPLTELIANNYVGFSVRTHDQALLLNCATQPLDPHTSGLAPTSLNLLIWASLFFSLHAPDIITNTPTAIFHTFRFTKFYVHSKMHSEICYK